MPVAPYGTTNPRGLEPWSIESTLAPLAVGGSQAEAQSMLGMYRAQREAAGNVYGEDLAQQHQYAYDALRQQMQEAYMKAVPEYAKSGTLGILASGSPQAFGSADPNVINSAVQAAQDEQSGKTFQSVMTGLNQGSQGGYQVAGGAVPGLAPNIDLTNKGPALAQAATIKGQFGLAEAGVRAAAGGAKGKSVSVPMYLGVDSEGHDIHMPVPIPLNATPAQRETIIANARAAAGAVYKPGSGVPGVNTGGDDSSAPPPPPPLTSPGGVDRSQTSVAPPPSRTSLPMAQQDTGRSGTQAAPASGPPQVVTDTKVQRLGAIAFKMLPQGAKTDVGANMGGTVLPIVQLPGGGYGFKGKTGATYNVPGPGG